MLVMEVLSIRCLPTFQYLINMMKNILLEVRLSEMEELHTSCIRTHLCYSNCCRFNSGYIRKI